jgi:HSP20 family protein
MVLVRWDPFREMITMRERMNRLFDDVFRTQEGSEGMPAGAWNPSVDIYETNNEVVLKAELPGLNQKDIHLDLKDNTLTLRGERVKDQEIKEDNYYRRERVYGTFHRAFTLPSTIQQDNIQAKYKEEVLEVHMPKAEAAKPRQIKVETN